MRNSVVQHCEMGQDKTRWLDIKIWSNCSLYHVLIFYWSHAIMWCDFANHQTWTVECSDMQNLSHELTFPVACVWMEVYGAKSAEWPRLKIIINLPGHSRIKQNFTKNDSNLTYDHKSSRNYLLVTNSKEAMRNRHLISRIHLHLAFPSLISNAH